MKLLPRIGEPYARLLISEVAGLSPAAARSAVESLSMEDQVHYTAAGGDHLPEGQVRALADRLRVVASGLGYPSVAGATAENREFDQASLRILHQSAQDAEIPVGETGRMGFWRYLACGVAPDLVIWRWGSPSVVDSAVWKPPSEDRYLRFVRNQFSRQWWRAHLLHDADHPNDPLHLVSGPGALTEDNLVAVVERPWTAGQPGMALAVGLRVQAHRRLRSESNVPGGMEKVVREVMKRLLRLSAFVEWSMLTHGQLVDVVDRVMLEVREALGESSPQRPPIRVMVAEESEPSKLIPLNLSALQRRGLPVPTDTLLESARKHNLETLGDLFAQSDVALEPDELRATRQYRNALRRHPGFDLGD